MPRIGLAPGVFVKVRGPKNRYPDFLADLEDWCEGWVQYVMKEEGVEEVTDDHRKVIDVIREYYEKNGIAPMARVLRNITGISLKRIYELFPSGPARGACRAAGDLLPPNKTLGDGFGAR